MMKKHVLFILIWSALGIFSCSNNSSSENNQALAGFKQTGEASWYGPGLNGNPTANGEVFDMEEFTAAHLKLPFDTRVRVTNLDNGKSVVVRINDRGPYAKDRIIDLSKAAAREIDMLETGTAMVRIETLEKEEAKSDK